MAKKSLPEDMVMDILARLPVKSLIRFKCVCKSWYALIKNPNFTKQHLNNPSSLHNNNKNTSILLIEDCRWGRPKASLLSITNKHLQVSEDMSMPFLQHVVGLKTFLQIHGPCNGILCLDINQEVPNNGDDAPHQCCDGGRYIALWNPATREFKVLPESCIPPPPGEYKDSYVQFGFGFDSKTNDYKVVRVSSYHRDYKDFWQNLVYQVEVYTLSTNRWRRVNTVVPATIWSSPRRPSPIYLKGFCYWLASVGKDVTTILSFDMNNEVFKKMLPPPDVGKGDDASSLLEFNGSLAAISKTKDWPFRPTIWVIASNNKWIKHLRIGLDSVDWCILGLWKDGDILFGKKDYSCMGERGKLASLDCNTREIVDYGVCGFPYALQVVFFKESLVSLSRKKE